MSARIGVATMAVLLLLYIVLVGQRTWLLLISGDAVATVMGVALVILPAVAMWALGRELWFGARADQLGRRLEQDEALPSESVAVRPSGRVVREDADALFPHYRSAAEANPDDWAVWFRLGLAYDASGDRRRAREAIRRAIRLESRSRRS
ncbi:tetratricopeptide repeat protein (plasmid) [Coraliomargarita sp. W4R53]